MNEPEIKLHWNLKAILEGNGFVTIVDTDDVQKVTIHKTDLETILKAVK